MSAVTRQDVSDVCPGALNMSEHCNTAMHMARHDVPTRQVRLCSMMQLKAIADCSAFESRKSWLCVGYLSNYNT